MPTENTKNTPNLEANNGLTDADFESLARCYITPEIAIQAKIQRVDNEEGAAIVGQKPNNGRRFSGWKIPYFHPNGSLPIEYRLRRDVPDYVVDADGKTKEEGKYLGPPDRRPVIYNPPLSWPHAEAKVVYFVEGEKKALAMSRYLHERGEAARVIGLAGVWAWRGKIGKTDHPATDKKVPVKGLLPELAAIDWREKCAVIIFDTNVHTNPKVRTARQRLTHQLIQRGAKVWHVDLPGDLPGVNGVDDLLGQKGPEFLAALIEQQTKDTQIQNLSFYAAEAQDVVPLAGQVWDALADAEAHDRTLFFVGGNLSRVQPQGDHVKIEEASRDVLTYRLANLAKWYLKKDDGSIRYTTPPKALVRHMLAAPFNEVPLPVLRRCVTAPVFTREGELITEAGYHEASGIYYLPAFQAKPLPASISGADQEQARKLIVAEMLPDFPFASEADRDNALALMLTPFVREIINGPTPLHLIEASVPGSGKGLLAHALLFPALGDGGIAITTQPEEDAEMSKRITSSLLSGKGAILFDNLSHTLDSGVLAAALTSRTWDDRILGTNKTANAENNVCWIATGNNPTLSSELTRRAVRTRLTPDTDKPEEREDFKHPVLLEWLTENRAEIVWAIHVMIKTWIQKGRPNGSKTLGSFEKWARVIGGILEANGFNNLLGNYREFRERADIERMARAAFCNEWYERMIEEEHHATSKPQYRHATAAALWNIARDIEGLPIEGSEAGAVRSMGRYLAANADVCPEFTVYDENERPQCVRRFRIIRGRQRNRAQLWEIELTDELPV